MNCKYFRHALCASFIALSVLFPARLLAADPPQDTLRLAIGLEPDSLDVHTYSTYQHALIARLFAGTLLDRDESGAIVGAAVKRYRQETPTDWIFTLRPDVFFHNGMRLTSEDVKYSLERIAQLNRKDFSTIKRVDVIDEANFRIVTAAPDPMLPSRLVPLGFIVPKKSVDEAGGPAAYFSAGTISGFGPYQLVRWEKGRFIEMKANPKFFKGKPPIEKLVFVFEPDNEKRVAKLLAGEVDVVADLPPISTLEIQRSGIAGVLKGATSQYVFGNMKIDNTESPLADIRVRKALNLAIDRKKLIQLVDLGNGIAIPTIFVRQALGYLDMPPYSHDPAAAKKLLAEAGYGKGLTLRLLSTTDLTQLAKALKSQFEAIGVLLEISEIKRDDGILDWLVKQTRTEDIFLLNPIDPMIDVGYHVETLIARYPRQKLPLIQRLAVLYRKSNETTEPGMRAALLGEIQKAIFDESLYLFLWQRLSLYGVSKRVKGFSVYVDGMIRLEKVRLEK